MRKWFSSKNVCSSVLLMLLIDLFNKSTRFIKNTWKYSCFIFGVIWDRKNQNVGLSWDIYYSCKYLVEKLENLKHISKYFFNLQFHTNKSVIFSISALILFSKLKKNSLLWCFKILEKIWRIFSIDNWLVALFFCPLTSHISLLISFTCLNNPIWLWQIYNNNKKKSQNNIVKF